MIVDARANSGKPLNVTSGDMNIPVSTAVVAFNHGTKESRVAVADGSVDVTMSGSRYALKAGQQYAPNFASSICPSILSLTGARIRAIT